MKKIWFLCAMLVCFIFPNGVNAVEVDAFLNSQPVYQYENPADELFPKQTRGLSLPQTFWNIASSGAYTANLVEVGWQELYTNYYFQSSTDGVLFLDYSIRSVESGYSPKMMIRLYRVNGSVVSTYTTGNSPSAACIRITGLNYSNLYYFSFQAVRTGLSYKSVTGTAKVYY